MKNQNSIPNTLKSLIKRGKDKLDFLSNQNVGYKIFCDDCEASYVVRQKKIKYEITRTYISDIKKNTGSPTIIIDHRINFDHNFRLIRIIWNEVKILDCESSYKGLVSEMIHSKRQKQDLKRIILNRYLKLAHRLFNFFLLLNCILSLFTFPLLTFFSLYFIFSLLCSPSFLVYHFNLLVLICVLYL